MHIGVTSISVFYNILFVYFMIEIVITRSYSSLVLSAGNIGKLFAKHLIDGNIHNDLSLMV